MEVDKLTEQVIGLAIEVHRHLGPGLLESAYQECLYYELKNANLKVERELKLPIEYKEIKLDHGYRIDLLIDEKFIVEIKAVEDLTDVHLAQLLTYLRLSNCKLGLLINFNVSLLKYGVKRVINGRL